jgi:hypothetical protein
MTRLTKYAQGLEEENHRLAERLEKQEVVSVNRAANSSSGGGGSGGDGNYNTSSSAGQKVCVFCCL